MKKKSFITGFSCITGDESPCMNYLVRQTVRQNPKIFHNGYGFIKMRSGTARFWVCDKRRRYGCKVTAKLDQEGQLLVKKMHNHSPTLDSYMSQL